ncbi:hypothetical protein PHYBOEH_008594 [Phytophthora boehmeriae]|uniref:Uncharacterized protein n=1 Tax=Phytophthora boehmeriae TaxID=109152 RepID=A0A8T1W2K6_9STRA|nr:hypothetical protein PHYBOEH_008594 [Phytophthora boehmeriae]
MAEKDEVEDEDVLVDVLWRLIEKKLEWLDERGVSLDDEDIGVSVRLVRRYLKEDNITAIDVDELKTTWEVFEEEAVEKMTELIQGGAHVNVQDEESAMVKADCSALSLAVASDTTKLVSLLLDQGANANFVNENNQSVLHFAVVCLEREMVSILLDRGADVTAKDESGATPLHWVASIGSSDIVELLIDRGADMAAAEESGATPLHSAASKCNTETVALLIDRGADMTAVDSHGLTALHVAANNGFAKTVSVLLDYGADVGVIDKVGRTPFESMITTSNLALDKQVAVARTLSSRGLKGLQWI